MFRDRKEVSMRKATCIVFAVLAFLCLFIAQDCHAAITSDTTNYYISAGSLRINIRKSDGYITTTGQGRTTSFGYTNAVYVYEGQTTPGTDRLLLASNRVNWVTSLSGGVLTCTYRCFHYQGAAMDITERWTVSGDNIYCNISAVNGDRDAWITYKLFLPVFFNTSNVNIWDGFNASSSWTGTTTRSELGGTFPLCSIDDGTDGLAVGIAADKIYSKIENKLSYFKNGVNVINYSVRTYTDANTSMNPDVTFIIYGFKANYGYRDAIDRYHKAYPAQFSPALGIDSRFQEVASAGGAQYASQLYPNDSYEPWRRVNSSVIWWYAPFKKAGDYYGTLPEWDIPLIGTSPTGIPYETLAKNAGYGPGKMTTIQNTRRTSMNNASMKNLMPMYYLIHWCEKDLAERRFSNQILKWKKGSTVMPYLNVPYVHNWCDSYKMWWGGELRNQTIEDIGKIMNDGAEIYGFAFDSADPCSLDGGNPSNPNVPGRMQARPKYGQDISVSTGVQGRAYDAEGPYVDSDVGIASMMDYVHTQYRTDDDKEIRMATWANIKNTYAYYVAFRSDAALSEHALSFFTKYELGYQERLRYMLGHKTSKFLASTSKEDLHAIAPFNGWQSAGPATIRGWFRDLWGEAMLNYFRLGLLPGDAVITGYEQMSKAMPALFEMIQEGWEPVPAFKLRNYSNPPTMDLNADPNIYTSRYGKGVHSYIFVGNNKIVSTDMLAPVIDNEYFADGAAGGFYIFNRYDGTSLTNTVNAAGYEGKTLLTATVLGKKQYQIYKSIAHIEAPNNYSFSAYASNKDEDISSGKVSIRFTPSYPYVNWYNIRFTVRIPKNSTVDASTGGITVNGSPVTSGIIVDSEKGEVSFTVGTLVTGAVPANTIVVNWGANVFKTNPKAYPFTVKYGTDYFPGCTIVIPDGADEWDSVTAGLVQDYFKYYYDKAMGKNVVLPIKTQSQLTASDVYQVRIGLDSTGAEGEDGEIKLINNDRWLCINASDSKSRNTLNYKMLRVLDQQYPYYGKILISSYTDRRGTSILESEDLETVAMREKAGLAPGGFLGVSEGISGQIVLQGYVGDLTQVPVSVELRNYNGTTSNGAINLESDGSFFIQSVDPGTYDIYFKASHWLGKLVQNVVVQ